MDANYVLSCCISLYAALSEDEMTNQIPPYTSTSSQQHCLLGAGSS